MQHTVLLSDAMRSFDLALSSPDLAAASARRLHTLYFSYATSLVTVTIASY